VDPTSRARKQNVADLIARREYARALALLREELSQRRGDPRLRVQLADVLILSGRTENGTAMLAEVADDLALSGRAAHAIAVLKRIQAVEPGRADVEEKLAYMIAQQKRPTPDPWRRARARIARAGAEVPAEQIASQPPTPLFPGDIEEIDEAAPAESPAPAAPLPEPVPVDVSAPPLDLSEADEAELRDELLDLIEKAFAPGAAAPVVAGDAHAAPVAVLTTPLFRGFAVDELVEVIRGLKLRHFEPGDIIVTEGEPGASLFVLTTGQVRAYVRNAAGQSVKMRDLAEGDFFGEVSLLRGAPRSATLTASVHCELLEIDRDTFGSIAQRHPRVWQVLKEFYDQRAGSTIEAQVRAHGLGAAR
jgi:hypothetical protein